MSSYLNDLEAQDSQETCDACKPVRNTFTALTKMFGKSKPLTALCILVPMIMMFVLLLYFEYGITTIYFEGYPYEFNEFSRFFSPPVLLVSSITFISGTVSLISLYMGFQNIISICSFVYSAIAYWAIVNTLIIVFCTYEYLNHDVIGYASLCSLIASFAWLFSSAVMDAHRKVLN